MGKSKGPFLPNTAAIIAAGINPKTGLPYRLTTSSSNVSKGDIKHFLRIIDEQDAVNRYVWFNLPTGISSQELERMLYYYGQLCFFYHKETGEFYFMRCTLDGSIDFYGRWNRIHPLPIYVGGEEKQDDRQKAYLETIKLNVIHSIPLEEPDEAMMTNSCVMLHDYTKQSSQEIFPRSKVNDALLDAMAECVPFMSTALINATGVRGERVADADSASQTYEANKTLKQAALNGELMVPIVSSMELQELTSGTVGKAEEFMLAMQSLDNLRLSGYGIDNGGLFEKKAHTLQSEADINGGPVGLVLQDGLSIRQNFCNIVNAIWDLGIWCEPAENITGVDANGDGVTYGRNDDASQSGVNGGADNEEQSNVQ